MCVCVCVCVRADPCIQVSRDREQASTAVVFAEEKVGADHGRDAYPGPENSKREPSTKRRGGEGEIFAARAG